MNFTGLHIQTYPHGNYQYSYVYVTGLHIHMINNSRPTPASQVVKYMGKQQQNYFVTTKKRLVAKWPSMGATKMITRRLQLLWSPVTVSSLIQIGRKL